MDAVRKSAVSGLFYPDNCGKITEMIYLFNRSAQKHHPVSLPKEIIPRAIIVPHAGYVYSGYTANLAYRSLKTARARRFIVIGPSHTYYFQGISGSFYDTFQTPCGNLRIDSPYLFALAKRFQIRFTPPAHEKEHSTEVQMPFLQHYFPDREVIELVDGEIRIDSLANLMIALLTNPDNILVVSSDLSHFHPLHTAKRIDRHCIEGIDNLATTPLEQCEACGITGIKALILAAKHLKLSSKVLHYTTSADYSHDTKSVVGYLSALFYR